MGPILDRVELALSTARLFPFLCAARSPASAKCTAMVFPFFRFALGRSFLRTFCPATHSVGAFFPSSRLEVNEDYQPPSVFFFSPSPIKHSKPLFFFFLPPSAVHQTDRFSRAGVQGEFSSLRGQTSGTASVTPIFSVVDPLSRDTLVLLFLHAYRLRKASFFRRLKAGQQGPCGLFFFFSPLLPFGHFEWPRGKVHFFFLFLGSVNLQLSFFFLWFFSRLPATMRPFSRPGLPPFLHLFGATAISLPFLPVSHRGLV